MALRVWHPACETSCLLDVFGNLFYRLEKTTAILKALRRRETFFVNRRRLVVPRPIMEHKFVVTVIVKVENIQEMSIRSIRRRQNISPRIFRRVVRRNPGFKSYTLRRAQLSTQKQTKNITGHLISDRRIAHILVCWAILFCKGRSRDQDKCHFSQEYRSHLAFCLVAVLSTRHRVNEKDLSSI